MFLPTGSPTNAHNVSQALRTLRVQEIKKITIFFSFKRSILLNSLINCTKYALTHDPEKLAQAWAEYSDIWCILIKMALTVLFNVSLKSKCVNHKPGALISVLQSKSHLAVLD